MPVLGPKLARQRNESGFLSPRKRKGVKPSTWDTAGYMRRPRDPTMWEELILQVVSVTTIHSVEVTRKETASREHSKGKGGRRERICTRNGQLPELAWAVVEMSDVYRLRLTFSTQEKGTC